MNKELSAILGPVVKRVREADKYSWALLKNGINDTGFYFADSLHEQMVMEYFGSACERALQRLPDDAFNQLMVIYYSTFPMTERGASRSDVTAHYSMVCLEEILRRARLAAARSF